MWSGTSWEGERDSPAAFVLRRGKADEIPRLACGRVRRPDEV